MVATDENLPISLDLVALLPDGAGESLAEELAARGLTTDDVAAASGIERQVLGAVLACKMVITDEMSRAISRGLGEPVLADFWARLDAGIRRDNARLARSGGG